MTVHHERRVKNEKPTRCNSFDFYYQTSISTRFGHHYAHHQENKSVHCRIWCSALVVLAVVVWSWFAPRAHSKSTGKSPLRGAWPEILFKVLVRGFCYIIMSITKRCLLLSYDNSKFIRRKKKLAPMKRTGKITF